MIKTILVPTAGGEMDRAALAAALAIARPFAAHIDALHVRSDPVEIAVAALGGDGIAASGSAVQRLIDEIEADAGKREAATRQFFTEFCAREKLPVSAAARTMTEASAQFHVEIGQEPRWMAAYALTADLTVAGRGAPGGESAWRTLLETLLLESGRPLLIPSADSVLSPPQRIAIGWKATAQAARAIAGAMPLIERANEIVVISVEEEGRDDTDRLVAALGWYGVGARVERLAAGPHGAAHTLVSAAMAAKTQLLVMGGYGHARLREWVFGGFTQHVLGSAPLPVLMAH